VKQKAIYGEGIRHCSGCLKNAVMSLLHNGEHMFLKKLQMSMFFNLQCGWDSNSLHGEWTKRWLISLFCVVILKTTSVHTKRHVTLHTFEYHSSCHAPHWTHATTPLLGVAARPVLIVTCVQSSDVSRSSGWSPNRHGWLWLMPSPCQHLSDKGESKISVWDFLPTTWR